MDKNITKREVSNTEQAIAGVAKVTQIAPEVVRSVLLKASVEDLEETVDGTDAIALFMAEGGVDLVDPERAVKLFKVLTIMDKLGNRGPDVDLSELVAQKKATTH